MQAVLSPMFDKTRRPEAIEFFWYLDIGYRMCLFDWKRRRLLFVFLDAISQLSSACWDELSADQTPWELCEKSNAADNRAKADNDNSEGVELDQ